MIFHTFPYYILIISISNHITPVDALITDSSASKELSASKVRMARFMQLFTGAPTQGCLPGPKSGASPTNGGKVGRKMATWCNFMKCLTLFNDILIGKWRSTMGWKWGTLFSERHRWHVGMEEARISQDIKKAWHQKTCKNTQKRYVSVGNHSIAFTNTRRRTEGKCSVLSRSGWFCQDKLWQAAWLK